MFTYRTRIRIYDTDAAGILFFGAAFRLMSEAFEEFLASTGSNMSAYVNDPQYLFPMVHTEADYKRPLRAGDSVSIRIVAEKISESTLGLAYTFTDANNRIAATGKTVAVAINKKTWEKTGIPPKFRKVFERLLA
jgi:YbgC/YbaW family acyl-CoA thioester hydrolase